MNSLKQVKPVEMQNTSQSFPNIVKAIPTYLNMTLVEKDANNFATFYGKHRNGEVVMYISYIVSLTGSLVMWQYLPTALFQWDTKEIEALIKGDQREVINSVAEDVDKLFKEGKLKLDYVISSLPT